MIPRGDPAIIDRAARQAKTRLAIGLVLALAGLTLVGSGLWMVYPPAMFIVLGLLIGAFGVAGIDVGGPRRRAKR